MNRLPIKCLALILVCMLTIMPAVAQPVGAHKVSDSLIIKAYFLARFSTWPKNMGEMKRYKICILSGSLDFRHIKHLLQGKLLNNKPVDIESISNADENLAKCHLVLMNGNEKNIEEIINVASSHPILTVGLTHDITKMGGIASFRAKRGNTILPYIKLKALKASRLHINADVLKLSCSAKTASFEDCEKQQAD